MEKVINKMAPLKSAPPTVCAISESVTHAVETVIIADTKRNIASFAIWTPTAHWSNPDARPGFFWVTIAVPIFRSMR